MAGRRFAMLGVNTDADAAARKVMEEKGVNRQSPDAAPNVDLRSAESTSSSSAHLQLSLGVSVALVGRGSPEPARPLIEGLPIAHVSATGKKQVTTVVRPWFGRDASPPASGVSPIPFCKRSLASCRRVPRLFAAPLTNRPLRFRSIDSIGLNPSANPVRWIDNFDRVLLPARSICEHANIVRDRFVDLDLQCPIDVDFSMALFQPKNGWKQRPSIENQPGTVPRAGGSRLRRGRPPLLRSAACP
jgi:hypothetical protein